MQTFAQTAIPYAIFLLFSLRGFTISIAMSPSSQKFRYPTTLFVGCCLTLSPALATSAGIAPALSSTGDPSPSTYSDLHWRLIGPFRAGRVVAVSGVPGSDGSFFFGGVDGGVWKTTDAGTVWSPIFDREPVASIGALAVAPSNPQIIYAGTGESDIRSDLSSGSGVYKSNDSGATWHAVGLSNTRQISQIVVDPQDPNTVYVAALGHAYGPSPERGVYKSTDGGATWQHVLDKGPDVGIAALAIAYGKPKILFATAWNAHRPPWSTYAPLEGPGNGLYRSTDAGETWTAINGHGLPAAHWGRSGVAVSADGRRVYLTIDTSGGTSGETAGLPASKTSGLYRSDDGGNTWTLVNADPRLTTRSWYFNSITVDPEDADTVYIPNVALFRTTDGGKTISIVRGAPGGDDYHQVWVDPKNSNHLMLGVDQGASASLDRGRTWTTWYNQPTAQLYHVTTDHKFPYTVYGAQQDSGSIAVASRSDHGHIDTRDWFLPGGSESGYLALDPTNEDIVYLSGTYGEITRFNRRTSFSQNITPWPLGGFDTPINKRRYRDPWSPVLVFSPAEKKSLYLGTQYVLKTLDGGLHWQQISPDLTGADNKPLIKQADTRHASPDTSATITVANAQQQGFGVVKTIAPSPLQAGLLWVGSDTGRIHLTRDGGAHWVDVTPPPLTPWSAISLVEASHFDPATAYAAVDRHRLDDQQPYLYITHNYGKSWQLSVDGIPAGHFLRAVREDPKQQGLLFAGTELGVSVSFNDGLRWQPLQLNLPAVSVRDLTIHDEGQDKSHDADLVIATHGRSFWILDDLAPLRQAAALDATKAQLYTPETAIRVDNDDFLGSPMPPEEPQADNPPAGATLDYYLPPSGAHTVQLVIEDAQGHIVRHFSSNTSAAAASLRPLLPIAERWFPKPQTLETTPGQHRFIWDLASGGEGIAAVDDDDSAGMPPGPRVPPGIYTARLNVDGLTLTQSLKVIMDPRSPAPPAILADQYALAHSIFGDAVEARKAMAELQSVAHELDSVKTVHPNLPAAALEKLDSAREQLEAIESGSQPDETANEKATRTLPHSLADHEPDHQADKTEADAHGRAAVHDVPSDLSRIPPVGLEASTAGLGTALAVVESGDRQPPSQAITIYHQMATASTAAIKRWNHYKQVTLPELNQTLQKAGVAPLEIASVVEQVHYAMTR
jgi:photosystem II stability/assembly factor-like uncharacterized protein